MRLLISIALQTLVRTVSSTSKSYPLVLTNETDSSALSSPPPTTSITDTEPPLSINLTADSTLSNSLVKEKATKPPSSINFASDPFQSDNAAGKLSSVDGLSSTEINRFVSIR